jgi:transposase-like protein
MEDYPRTLLELERRFSTEEACRQYLFALRWPAGFSCPRCGGLCAWATARGLWMCGACQYQVSVTAGTIFQDTHLSLILWFRAMWLVVAQKNGASALGIQRALGLGSYKTAWAMLHKLRRAMVRPGRDRLTGRVEVDETYWGGEEEGVVGRLVEEKAIILVAAQADGAGIGRIRMRRIPDVSRSTLHGFIRTAIEPGSVVITDGWPAYRELTNYHHEPIVISQSEGRASALLPRVHRVVSLLKRWALGTHQGAMANEHLDDYLNEFTFRFNRRTSASRGKLFYRLVQQAAEVEPAPFASLTHVNL